MSWSEGGGEGGRGVCWYIKHVTPLRTQITQTLCKIWSPRPHLAGWPLYTAVCVLSCFVPSANCCDLEGWLWCLVINICSLTLLFYVLSNSQQYTWYWLKIGKGQLKLSLDDIYFALNKCLKCKLFKTKRMPKWIFVRMRLVLCIFLINTTVIINWNLYSMTFLGRLRGSSISGPTLFWEGGLKRISQSETAFYFVASVIFKFILSHPEKFGSWKVDISSGYTLARNSNMHT